MTNQTKRDPHRSRRALLDAFVACYGPGPVRVFFAPGRVNLIGAHVDYNGGVVLPVAIDLGVEVAIRARTDRTLVLRSLEFAPVGAASVDGLAHLVPAKAWFDYPLGALKLLSERVRLEHGAQVLVSGSVPAGAGLASSAALLVATLAAFRAIEGLAFSNVELAEIAYRAETEFAGARIGRMDQLASALCRPGEALLIDFRDGRREPVALPARRMSLVVLDSKTRHELRSTTQRSRVAEAQAALALLQRTYPELPALGHLTTAELFASRATLPEIEWRRARHVVTEVERVLQCRDALARADLTSVGHLLNLSHASSRNDYETSTPQLDLLQEAAVSCPEVFGARLSGGGFGGCVVALVEPGTERTVVDRVSARFERAFGICPEAYLVHPGGGLAERSADHS